MASPARQNLAPARSLPRGAAAGLAATMAMDLGAQTVVARALGMKPLGPRNLGRWIGHMREGRFTHDAIETTGPVPREAAIGVAAHYLIGPALGVGYTLVLRLAGIRSSLPLGIGYGIATTAFPWFIVYPAYGWGAMGLQAGGGKIAAFALLNHLVFGAGLGLTTASREAGSAV